MKKLKESEVVHDFFEEEIYSRIPFTWHPQGQIRARVSNSTYTNLSSYR
jgi:hypothetical protein